MTSSWDHGWEHQKHKRVLAEIVAERYRQDKKWGEQNWPLVDPVLVGRDYTRMAQEYEIPTHVRATFLCQLAADRNQLTWGHILVEELAEFVADGANTALARAELIQVAAVAVAAIEAIDRQHAKETGINEAEQPRLRSIPNFQPFKWGDEDY